MHLLQEQSNNLFIVLKPWFIDINNEWSLDIIQELSPEISDHIKSVVLAKDGLLLFARTDLFQFCLVVSQGVVSPKAVSILGIDSHI